MPEDIKSQNNIEMNWETIEGHLIEGTYSGYKSAIIEMEKILKDVLNLKELAFDEEDDLFERLKGKILEPEKLRYARKIYGGIITQRNYNPTYFETRNAIEGYYLAISDIQNLKSQPSFYKFKINLLFAKLAKFIRSFVFLILAFFIVAVIFADTGAGQFLFSVILSAARFFVYKGLPTIGIVLAAIFIVLFAAKFIKTRKSK